MVNSEYESFKDKTDHLKLGQEIIDVRHIKNLDMLAFLHKTTAQFDDNRLIYRIPEVCDVIVKAHSVADSIESKRMRRLGTVMLNHLVNNGLPYVVVMEHRKNTVTGLRPESALAASALGYYLPGIIERNQKIVRWEQEMKQAIRDLGGDDKPIARLLLDVYGRKRQKTGTVFSFDIESEDNKKQIEDYKLKKIPNLSEDAQKELALYTSEFMMYRIGSLENRISWENIKIAPHFYTVKEGSEVGVPGDMSQDTIKALKYILYAVEELNGNQGEIEKTPYQVLSMDTKEAIQLLKSSLSIIKNRDLSSQALLSIGIDDAYLKSIGIENGIKNMLDVFKLFRKVGERLGYTQEIKIVFQPDTVTEFDNEEYDDNQNDENSSIDDERYY